MPIGTTIPTVPFDASESILGQKCIFAFLPTGGSQENLRAKIAALTPTVSKIEKKQVNDTTKLLEVGRTDVTEMKWGLRLSFDEFSAEVLAFINSPYRVGTGRLWVVDPTDATDTASLLSNEFACTITPDGEQSFNAENYAEAGIMIDINGAFSLARDASTA